MAYNVSKGPRKFGDLINEGDVDTHVDWDSNTIRFRTNNATRMQVENGQVSSSVLIRTIGSVSSSGDFAATGSVHATNLYGNGAGITSVIAAAVSGTTAQLTTGVETSGYLKVSGSTTLDGTTLAKTIKSTGAEYSGSGKIQVVGAITAKGNMASSGSVTAGTSFIVGSADMDATDLEKLDGITNGTAAANKAVVLDGSKNIATLGSVGCAGLSGSGVLQVVGNTILGGTLNLSGTTFSKSIKSTGAEYSGSGKIQVVGAITAKGAIASSGSVTAGTSFVIGSADINETDLEKIDGITNGTAAVNKAVVLDGSKNIATIGTVGCGAITTSGLLSSSAGLNIVGAASLIGNIASSGSITAGSSIIVGSADMDATDLEKLDGITNGAAAANKAVVLDGSKNIATLGTVGCGAITTGGAFSGSAAFHTVGAATFGGSIITTSSVTAKEGVTSTGVISSSNALQNVGVALFGNNLSATGSIQAGGDIILDDGGSLKEAGGTAAFTYDGSGHVTKIGQDSPSTNQVLTWDGSKAVWNPAGAISALSGTTAQLTTGVETSGYLKVTGSSTLAAITCGTITTSGLLSSSAGLNVVGVANFIGNIATSGSITSDGDIILDDGGSLKEAGGTAAFTYDGSGHVTKIGQDSPSSGQFLKWDGSKAVWDASSATTVSGTTAQLTTGVETSGYLKVTGSSTLGPVTATTYSGSSTMQVVGNSIFGGTLGVTGSSTFTGVATHIGHPLFNSGITIKNADASAGYINFYEQSSNGTNVCTFRGKSSMGNCTITLPGDTGTVVLEDNTVTLSNKTLTAPKVSAFSGSSTLHNVGATTLGLTLVTSGSVTAKGGIVNQGAFSGSSTMHNVAAATFGNTLKTSGSITSAGDIILDDGGSLKEAGGTAAFTYDGSGHVTKIGQDSPSSGQFLKWDGSKAVWDASSATTVSGTTAQLTTGVETSGYLKVTGSSTLGAITATTYSGSSTMQVVGNSIFGGTFKVSGAATLASTLGCGAITSTGASSYGSLAGGAFSGSSTMHNVGAATFGGTLKATGSITSAGDIILDDGGSLKEAGGTAAFTYDGSGHVTKIGQDSPSEDQVLTWDGSKAVWSAAAGGTPTSLSGTTAQLTTGVETSGYLKVTGSSTLGAITATTYSGSSTMHSVGNVTFGGTLKVTGSTTLAAVAATTYSGSSTAQIVGNSIFGGTVTVSGNVGLGVGAAKVALDVHQDPGLLVNDTGGGEVMKRGAGTTTAGKLYFLHSGSGAWLAADADTPESGSNKLLAIALGSTPNTHGMLLRGYFDVHTYLTGAYNKGQAIYMSDAAGYISTYSPSGSGDVVRIVGHAIDNTNVVYFNPSPDWIEQ